LLSLSLSKIAGVDGVDFVVYGLNTSQVQPCDLSFTVVPSGVDTRTSPGCVGKHHATRSSTWRWKYNPGTGNTDHR
jgi:hypothetical protein